MTFHKLMRAIEVSSALWIKLLPILRDIVAHYQVIMNTGELTDWDKSRGKALVEQLNDTLGKRG